MTDATPAAAPPRLDELTALRFFAAAAIVLFHLSGPILPIPALPSLAMGVSFFFVLSGFILAYVYGELRDVRVATFLWHRFARLWPLHAATFALAVLLVVPPAHLGRPDWQATALANLLLVHAWIPLHGVTLSVNTPSWSISAEFFFYLAFPLLARVGRIGIVWVTVLTATLAVVAALDVVGVAPAKVQGEFSLPALLLHAPWLRLAEFVTGVAAARWLYSGRLPWLQARVAAGAAGAELAAVLAIVLAAVAAGGLVAMRDQLCASGTRCAYSTLTWASQAGGMLVFAAAIVVFAQGRGPLSRWLRTPWLVRLGEISFATYLLHQIVIKMAKRDGWFEAMGWPWVLLAVVGIVYAGSWGLWRVVESPARRWLLARGPAGWRGAEPATGLAPAGVATRP